MNLKTTTIIAASLLFTGCASTTKTAPTLEQSNEPVYAWDDSRSLALNITKAAIEVPPSLRDTEVPQGASITKTGVWRDSAAVVDLLSNGLGGLFAGELFRNTSGKEWRPTYIWLEPATSDTTSSYSDAMATFAQKFSAMLEPVDELAFVDYFTVLKKSNNWESSYIIVEGEWCAQAEGMGQQYDLSIMPPRPDIDRGLLSFDQLGCIISFRMNPVRQLVNESGENFNVYSITAGAFYKHLTVMSGHFDGYFAHPARAKEVGYGSAWGYDYPFVLHDGKLHLFTNPEQVIEFTDL